MNKNKFTIGDRVIYDGILCDVVDFRLESGVWLYDLENANKDFCDAFNDIQESLLKGESDMKS